MEALVAEAEMIQQEQAALPIEGRDWKVRYNRF